MNMSFSISRRIKEMREISELTQSQLAELIGVSFATVNRWENGQSQPSNVSWRRILEIETQIYGSRPQNMMTTDLEAQITPDMDFSASPDVVQIVAEAHRLAYGHLFNRAFATETSLIDPLPHQRLAVYDHMLKQSRLRFLLADDAGAGKTIMTGLYVREMLARLLIRRVLIVPPAGLVGNWERELRELFRLRFRIVTGSDAREGNPFIGEESNLTIVSVDTLAGERMFDHLRDVATEPYDLVVFDEAHKLSADKRPDSRERKTARYKLAEAIAGASPDSERWTLPWSTQHLLLLTATPHMGKDAPYYFLWRLLLPDELSTISAFQNFPDEAKKRHFIRRIKEELVDFKGSPLYPTRTCDTLSYHLTAGPDGEQELYDETTEYLRTYYANSLTSNPSAAKLAMSVFQRRMASSTYALIRSFERRIDKLEDALEQIRDGRITEEELARRQRHFVVPEDIYETQTSDEYSEIEGDGDSVAEFEDRVLEASLGLSLAELEAERIEVEGLLNRARQLYARGQESKFETLWEVVRSKDYADEKFIIFTEHRDTADFLIRRLEGLGFSGQVASIHGGIGYRQREEQVEFFRRPIDEEGANFLVATDAAGEGINLQFCWIMVNYDIPWNPARLEQRMGRIHRYGQLHDPVVVINLVAVSTREGRVMETLLKKLETIRKQLDSDKVFDVIGRLFEGISIKDYLERTLTDEDTEAAIAELDGKLTKTQVEAIQDRESLIFGQGGDVRQELVHLNDELDQEVFQRLLPGYVRNFIEKATDLLDIRIDGDMESTFRLIPRKRGALDPLLSALEMYSADVSELLTVHRPDRLSPVLWIHPGEPLFDHISDNVTQRFGREALRGSVFVDPYSTEPYLFHLALVTVEQERSDSESEMAELLTSPEEGVEHSRNLRESSLVGLRQESDGSVKECPVEHLLLLRGAKDFAPGREPLAALARNMVEVAGEYAKKVIVKGKVNQLKRDINLYKEERLNFVKRGFDHQVAELTSVRAGLRRRAQRGDVRASNEYSRVRDLQRELSGNRDRRLRIIEREPDTILPGKVTFLAHSLVVSSQDPEEIEAHSADVESVAMKMAMAHERLFDAKVHDVSSPALARSAGLKVWPGFDLLSVRSGTNDDGAERRCIEVKGRRGDGSIQMSYNEWVKACNLGSDYWLYVVFGCATPNPHLIRVNDPFHKLIMKGHQSMSFTVTQSELLGAAEGAM